jgi:hypothetical protein
MSSVILVAALIGLAEPTPVQAVASNAPTANRVGPEDAKTETVSFTHDVQPILTRYGCNQGACHGAALGKGGFRLSLRGFDDEADFQEIVRAAKGRRVFRSDAEGSLILTKPTLDSPHQGGKRFEVDSKPYLVLKQWIEQGLKGPSETERKVVEIKVEPAEIVAEPGRKVALRVVAVYSDGTRRSVADRTSFDTLSPAVAEVTPDGEVTVKGRGETAIMVRHQDRVSVSRVLSPYLPPVGKDAAAASRIEEEIAAGRATFKPRMPIDELWLAKWGRLGLSPSGECSDAEFFRRIHLDVIGTLPEPDAIRAFLADRSPDKRDRAIDAVLERPEYVDYQAYKWGDLLRNNREIVGEKGMWAFHEWLRESFRTNLPMDRFARTILTAAGSPGENGPANFYRVGRQPEDWAENTAQVFLGVRMQCARCHHHPFENISQRDYYALTAVFSRLTSKRSEEFGVYEQDTVLYIRDQGEARHPRTGKVIPPACLGAPLDDNPLDRRQALADWLGAKDRRALARNLVNRYWGYLMGRGLIHPVDDIRVTNPAASEEVLDRLARDFEADGFDLKKLLRGILRSAVYQRSALDHAGNEIDGDNRYFTRYTARRLTAEQLLDAIDAACGTRERFQNLPEGYRAISLPDSRVASRFMDAFGRPRREIACECERVDTPNMIQALQFLTGELLHRKVTDPNGRVADFVKRKVPIDQVIDEVYLRTVCRPPTDRERADAKQMLAPPTPLADATNNGSADRVGKAPTSPPAIAASVSGRGEPAKGLPSGAPKAATSKQAAGGAMSKNGAMPKKPAVNPAAQAQAESARYRTAVEDLLWVMLNTREFQFQH